MSEIEFLTPEDLPSEPRPGAAGPAEVIGGDGPDRQRRTLDPVIVLATLAFLTAAALAVVACFRTEYRIVELAAGHRFEVRVDGWGRYRVVPGPQPPHPFHETRYGIALTAVAAGSVVLAFVLVVNRLLYRARAVSLIVAAGAVGLASALVGVLAAVALEINAKSDQVRATLSSIASEPGSGRYHLHLDVGSCIWFGLGALGAALVAVVFAFRVRHSALPQVPDMES